jgi:hypothetical protein
MKNISVPWMIALLAGLAAAHLSPVGITVSLALLLAWSLLGPAACIQSLTLATCLTYLNPGIGVLPTEAGILGRAILVVAAVRVLPVLRIRDLTLLWPIWAFSLVAAILSFIASSSVSISIMKVITFAVAASTVITAYNSLPPQRISGLQRWFATVAVFFVASSLATLAVPHIAFLVNGTGFQGLLNNAQALAIVLSPLAAWHFTGLMFVRGKLRVLQIAAVAAIYGALFLSESRTGMASSLIGIAAAALTWLVATHRATLLASRGRVIAMMATAALCLTGALATGHLQSTVAKFAFKRAESRDVSGAFLESRGGGVVSQWRNFVDQPWLGHGFGVYAEGPPSSSVVEAFGIPISAPIEKGFVFTAVLEETGALGGLLFFTALFVLGRAVWKNQDLRWVALFTSCIAVNIGECILLAPGGIGLLDWLLIGLAISSARAAPARAEALALAEPAVIRFPNLLRS